MGFDGLALAYANHRALHATDDEPRTDREGQWLAVLHTRCTVAVDLSSGNHCLVAQFAVVLLQKFLLCVMCTVSPFRTRKPQGFTAHTHTFGL